MQDLEYIDNYFKGVLPPDETGRFEQRIMADAPFAEAVSFYCMAMQAAKEELVTEKKKRFREIYGQRHPAADIRRPALVRRLMPFAAAAAVLVLVVLGWWIWGRPVSAQQLAGRYTQEHFARLDVTMSSREDSLQTGLRLYNDGKQAEALQQFESILQRNRVDFTALRYAGIVSLQAGEYDKALQYFRRLEQYPGTLYSNPGKFYYALTLMKRNKSGDPEQAKKLLQEVVQQNLEGKATAQQWLRKW